MTDKDKIVFLSEMGKLLAKRNLSQLSLTSRRNILSILNAPVIKKQITNPIYQFSGKCSYFIPIPKVEIGKLPYTKKDFRAILIIYILSDGQKHNQTEIVALSNLLHDEIISKGANASIFEKIGWCGEVILGVMHSGPFNDGVVNRTVEYLEDIGIIERKAIKKGKGAYPVYNWLKKDPTAFLKILEFLKSGHWDDEIFPLLGGYLINSPHGEEVINKETIDEILKTIGESYTEDEKQMVLKIVKTSPSALLGLLDLFIGLKSSIFRGLGYEKKESCEQIFNDLGINLGEDMKKLSFRSKTPVQYTITVDFSDKNNDGQKKKCLVDGDKLKIWIQKK